MATFRFLRVLLPCIPIFSAAVIPGHSVADEPWPAECKLQLAASLPFSIEHGHIRIDVLVNDNPRKFIVDTGGFISSVTPKVVESQGLKTRPISDSFIISGIGGQKIERYTVADSLTIAHLRAKDVRLMVKPGPDDGEEDGVIAPEYLRNFDIEIDFANKRLNLFHPHPCSNHAVYWTDQFTALPMDITPQGHIRVRATLDGEEFEAMVDTGSPATLIGARTAAARFGIGPQSAGVVLTGAAGGSAFAAPHRFQHLQLGNITINNPPLLVSSDEAPWRSDDAGLLLGLRELGKFHVYIAYRERTIYLSPIPSQRVSSPAQ